MKRKTYTAFGLLVSSEYLFPELRQIHHNEDVVDVIIELADLSEYWHSLGPQQNYYAVNDGHIAFHMPDTGIFLIQEGNKILVSPFAWSDEKMIRVYLLGSCMGALLMQRKILPLHGSAVAVNGNAFAFVGHSGAGKSTLAAALLNLGLPLLSDDVIPVTLDDNGTPVVTPAYPQQKLWKKSIDALGLDSNSYSPLYQEVDKYAIPVSDKFCVEPVPLAGVFEITVSKDEKTIIRPVQGLQRFPVLVEHTYRNFLIPLLNLEEWHFNLSAQIVARAFFAQITRSSKTFTANLLTNQILNMIHKGA